jgi:hypothetical protein
MESVSHLGAPIRQRSQANIGIGTATGIVARFQFSCFIRQQPEVALCLVGSSESNKRLIATSSAVIGHGCPNGHRSRQCDESSI